MDADVYLAVFTGDEGVMNEGRGVGGKGGKGQRAAEEKADDKTHGNILLAKEVGAQKCHWQTLLSSG